MQEYMAETNMGVPHKEGVKRQKQTDTKMGTINPFRAGIPEKFTVIQAIFSYQAFEGGIVFL
jgi:hypothetical protein